MPLAVDLEHHPLVHKALASNPVANAGIIEQVNRGLLQNPGPHSLLDVCPAPRLEHDGVDTFAL